MGLTEKQGGSDVSANLTEAGQPNPIDVVCLKDKMGNRPNASAELELDGTWARRLGDEGRGVRTIIEMVAATRLDALSVRSARAPGRAGDCRASRRTDP